MLQYDNRGRIDGIRGPVDLNVFDGDAAAFGAWRVSGRVPFPPVQAGH